MKKILALASALFLLNAASVSADPAKSGVEALQKNRYEEAVVLFTGARAQAKPDALDSLNFGVALAESAKLYRDLYALSVKLHVDYLERIAPVAGRERSRYARLYLGRTLLEAGKPKEAARAFERFLTEKTPDEDYRHIARAGLGLAYHRLGMGQKALSVWGQIKATGPEVTSELARAYASAGNRDKDAVALADRAFELVKSSRKRPSAIVTANLLGVYASGGFVDRGLEVLKASGTSNLEGCSYEEKISEYKTIRFYDTRLLGDLGAFYGAAAVKFLKEAATDAKLKGAAGFYLAETYGLLNDTADSERARTVLSSGSIPTKLNYRAEMIGVENLFRSGKKDEAIRRLKGYSGANPPETLMAEALLTCAKLGIACKDIASKAEASAAGPQNGKRLSVFNRALGRYFLFDGDLVKAIRYMEEGRDKSKKNKIEFNDPRTLTALSEAYCGTKQYSEALEIFFEMNKHFPAVRQLQIVLQGIYSMEHRSAGDVKIL